MLGFTIPRQIGKDFISKKEYEFIFITKAGVRNKTKKPNTISLSRLIPDQTIRKYSFFKFDYEEKLFAWIYSRGTKFAILSQEIPLKRNGYDLLELAGSFFCEGFRARKKNKHCDRLSFSNADPEQIKWFINAIEMILDIKKDEWNAQILLKDKSKSQKMKRFWSTQGINKNKITTVHNDSIRAEHGVCILNIYNRQ